MPTKEQILKAAILTANQEVIPPKDLHLVAGISKTTAWRLSKQGDFPKKIQLSQGRVGYLRSELEQWLASRREV